MSEYGGYILFSADLEQRFSNRFNLLTQVFKRFMTGESKTGIIINAADMRCWKVFRAQYQQWK